MGSRSAANSEEPCTKQIDVNLTTGVTEKDRPKADKSSKVETTNILTRSYERGPKSIFFQFCDIGTARKHTQCSFTGLCESSLWLKRYRSSGQFKKGSQVEGVVIVPRLFVCSSFRKESGQIRLTVQCLTHAQWTSFPYRTFLLRCVSVNLKGIAYTQVWWRFKVQFSLLGVYDGLVLSFCFWYPPPHPRLKRKK